MKKFLLPLCLVVALFFLVSMTSAQGQLEVEYPTINEYYPQELDSDGFPAYMEYIIRFLIIGAGIVVFGTLVYGGFLWMTSAGEPLKLQKSKQRLISSVAGLVVVVSSYIWLSSINPTLVKLQQIESIEVIDDVTAPGIYLSKTSPFPSDDDEESIRENVRRINSSERALGSLRGEIQSIRIVNPTERNGDLIYRYVVVLHEEENFQGKCKFYVNNQSSPSTISITDIGSDVSSVSIVRAERYGTGVYGRAVAYDKPEFQEGSNSQSLSVTTTSENFSSLNIEPWSIDIEGRYAIILASGSSWQNMNDGCAVFASSRPITTLVGHYMNRCSPYFFSEFFAAYRSCSTHYASFPLYTQ